MSFRQACRELTNDRITFQGKTAGVLMAYDPEGRSLGKIELTSPRSGWFEFKPASGGRMYLFGPQQ
jgi:hypothetical protein